MRADVIVVGGGIAGTVAAATAARTGATVVLLEAAAPGGRARTHVQGGFAFNQGPHALYAGGAFRRTLDELGVPWSGRAPALDAGIALWGAAHYPLPSSLASLATARPFGVRDRIELAKFWGRVGKGADAGDGTLRDVTRSMRPKVGAFVEAFSRLSTYANAPDAIDARAAFAQMRLALGGVLYLDGGWQTLVDGLAAAATRAGAVIVPSARAATVERAGSDWRVALVDGREWRGGAVVLAVSPGDAARLAPAAADAAAATVPLRAVCLDLALSSLPAPCQGFALGIDDPLYLSAHSLTARLAPEGGALVHAARYLDPGEAPSAAHVAGLEAMLDRIQPGWRAVEVARQRLLGMVVAHDFVRPGHRRAPIAVADRLFLAGDWVGEEGMLSDASAASGIAAGAAAAA